MIIRYQITRANGSILEDTRSLPDLNPYIIQGYYLEQSTYALNYIGKTQMRMSGTPLIGFQQ
jgi:hypothetical protein